MLSCLMRPQDKRHDALTHLCPFFCDLLGLYCRSADACPHRLSRLTGLRLSYNSLFSPYRRNIVSLYSLYSLSLLTLFAACYYCLFLSLKLRIRRCAFCQFLNADPTGDFAHNPEPLEKNLSGIMDEMKTGAYNLGIVVDPDVDRLAFICEDGRMFGEEYTLVSVADYVLSHTPGNTVSNLSSTRALRDVTQQHGGTYTAVAVGEVNVTTKMKEVGAVIGGEGNGGVIYPESHYGRDALVGIALFLSSLAHKGCKVSELRATFPEYFIAKNRIDLTPSTDVDAILEKVKQLYANEQVNDIDGVKIDFPDKWVHLRKSNTEPIIRVYSEASTMEAADALGKQIMQVVYDMQ